jgi:hypothetical protein
MRTKANKGPKSKRKRTPPKRVIDVRTPLGSDVCKDGLTQSMIGKSLCPRAFVLMLNGYTVEKPSTYFGLFVHEVLAYLYSDKKRPKRHQVEILADMAWADLGMSDTDENNLIYSKTVGVLSAYVEHYRTDWTQQHTITTEEIFDLPLSPKVLARRRGKIDRKFWIRNKRSKAKEIWIQEHKTHGRIKQAVLDNLLSIKFQNIYYAMTDDNVVGILHNVIRNPGSKPHKDETLEDYERRLTEDALSRPDHYFMRWEINCSAKGERSMFLEDLDFLIARCQDYEESGKRFRPPANPLVCEGQEFPCDYLSACATNSMLGYIQKPLYGELSK